MTILCKRVYMVEYTESGWGLDIWVREFDSQEQAYNEVQEVNRWACENYSRGGDTIIAKYLGERLVEI